jgi:hypothetical protein|tara:strand:- start:1710 stop:1964 length:255 start_codon:yes stop_codon:yes gene_type:complete
LDEKRNRINNNVIWDIFEGDLVQVKRYTPNGDEYFEKGIVVAEKGFDQILLFPYVNVYVFNTNTIEKHLPNTIEIISSKRQISS